MKTQCDKLLYHLQRGSSITAMSAFRLFDITCLAERVRDLKRRGIEVRSEMIKLASGKRIARYSL